MMHDEEFDLIESINETPDVEVTEADFQFADTKNISHDQKFETKPTTFLKDSLKRFSKNKSSVVAAFILGTLILLSFVVPIVDRNDLKSPNNVYQTYLEPKLFNAGAGWWDGTKSYKNIPVDPVSGYPDPETFTSQTAISDLKIDKQASKYNSYSKYGKGGYVNLNAEPDYFNAYDLPPSLIANPFSVEVDLTYGLTIRYTLVDVEIETFERAPYMIYFNYAGAEKAVELYDSMQTDYEGDFVLDAREVLLEKTGLTKFSDAYFSFGLTSERTELNKSVLIKSLEILTDDVTETSTEDFKDNYKPNIEKMGFTDATEFIGRTREITQGEANPIYWSCNAHKYLRDSEVTFCSFKYDTYEAAFGIRRYKIDEITMKEYRRAGWCAYSSKEGPSSFKILNEKKCPIVKVYDQGQAVGGDGTVTLTYECDVIFYKYLGYSSAPRYLLGTDNSGRDMLKYVFEGLRTSLLLGICTFLVCFLFGLLWGSISGYFGGLTDLLMERFTDILGSLPWIVLMTLMILHMGQTFFVFALALCMTGWIGTSSLTRTQFYRFKRREYVLASRTLGSKDMRLIYKHILPNAMGTIITSAVLMIPSVVFSEATISYLGLGLKGMSSLGVILSDNQSELLAYPHLLIFPSIIIALLMITFNLFGNGLRDAVNPSLKGEGE